MKAVWILGLAFLLVLLPAIVPAQDNGMLFQISAREYFALVELYEQGGGAGWQNNEGWLNPDATSWQGVTVWGVDYDVDGDVLRRGIVIGLSLTENDLFGELPPAVGDLQYLRDLDLSGNALTGIPSSISNLTSLSTLNLSRNQLVGSIPQSIFALKNLQDLSLADNQLTGTIPKSLVGLPQLRRLNLSGNQFNGSLPNLSLLPLQSTSVTNNFLETTGSSWESIQAMLRRGTAVSYLPQRLKLIGSWDGGAFTLGWNASPRTRSQLQYTTDLRAEDWLDLGSPILTGTDRSPAFSDPAISGPQKFYRVMLLD